MAKLDTATRQELESFIEHFAREIRKVGSEWALNCPDPLCASYGKGDKLKLYFNVKTGVGFCFRCESPFSMIDLVRFYRHMDWRHAEEFVNKWRGIRIPKDGVLAVFKGGAQEEDAGDPPLVSLPEEFEPIEEKHFKQFPYIQTRMTFDIARRYRVGICRRGYFHDRLIVPVYMPDGLRTFVARYMTPNPQTVQKVIYPKGTKTSMCLFNYSATRKRKRLVLVEGVFDALKHGPNFLALFGTHLSKTQLALLQVSRPSDIVVALDPDAKGKALKMARALSVALPYATVRVAYPDRDPDEYSRSAMRALVEKAALPHVSALLGAFS